MPEIKTAPQISPLTAQEDGNFAVFVDDKLFGEISANPKAAFIIYDRDFGPTERKKGRTFAAGNHTVEWRGAKYSVVVKDLTMAPLPDIEDFSGADRQNFELLKRMIHTTRDGQYVTNPATYPNLLKGDMHKEHNKKFYAELFGRVVVTKI